jgi:hypothetical protein
MSLKMDETENSSWIPACAGMTEKKGIPKSGLTKIMRAWMSARAHSGPKTKQRFTVEQLCTELDVKAGSEHQKVRNALGDFEKRGEITSRYNRKHNRRQYYYNHNWRKAKKGTQNQKIFKAMYVSQSFAVTDIQRLAGEEDRCWIDKIVRHLKKDGLLQKISKRLCAHGAGSEAVYHIVNRDKFKLENMK